MTWEQWLAARALLAEEKTGSAERAAVRAAEEREERQYASTVSAIRRTQRNGSD